MREPCGIEEKLVLILNCCVVHSIDWIVWKFSNLQVLGPFSYIPTMLVFVVALSSWGSAALAAPGIPHSTGQQFSRQARIGFHVGDDWEPSITADRYGHVYEKPCFIVAYDTLIEGRH